MLCARFEQRLQQLLDERERPELDAPLAAHAELCEHCRGLLASWEFIEEGLLNARLPEPSPHLARRVLVESRQPLLRPSRAPRMGILAGLAMAAMLLMALYLPRQQASPPAQTQTTTPRDDTEYLTYWLSGDPTDQYLSMMRLTGQAMATYPVAVRRVALPDENIRSTVNPISAALDAFLKSFSAKPGEKSS